MLFFMYKLYCKRVNEIMQNLGRNATKNRVEKKVVCFLIVFVIKKNAFCVES